MRKKQNFGSLSFGADIAYYLFDRFVTDRAAPLPATFAMDPGPGTWSVRDVETNTISVSGGAAVFVPQATPAWGEQDLVCKDKPITRAAGQWITSSFLVGTAGLCYPVGLSDSQTPTYPTNIQAGFYLDGSLDLYVVQNGAIGAKLGVTLALDTDYDFKIQLLATGFLLFIEGGDFTTETLLYVSSSGSTATLYVASSGYSAGYQFQGPVKAPTAKWSASALDTSGIGVVTPIEGSELIVNGGMEIDSNWASTGTPLTNERSAEQAKAGTYSRKIVVNGQFQGCFQIGGALPGGWYKIKNSVYGDGSNKVAFDIAGIGYNLFSPLSLSAAGYIFPLSWTDEVWSGRALVGTYFYARLRSGTLATAGTFYIDEVSMKPFTLSSLFSLVELSGQSFFFQVPLTLLANLQQGLGLYCNSTSNPTAGIVAYYNKVTGKVLLESFTTATTWTTVLNVTATYAAGGVIQFRGRHTGTSIVISVWYNNALIGSATVSDAEIISNTCHGKFGTGAEGSEITYDTLVIYPAQPDMPGFLEAV